MKSRQPPSPTLSVVLDEALSRRQSGFLPDGSYLFQDQLILDGSLTARVITCTAWLFELYQLTRGAVSFVSGPVIVRPATRVFAVVYPPFSITKLSFKSARGKLIGLARNDGLPSQFPRVPLLFDTEFTDVPSGVEQVVKILIESTNRQDVSAFPNPSLLSLKAKRLIDENYSDYPSIARIARRLGVSPEHLSRQFKSDFEISPSSYLHQLRLADAPLRLAKGEDIINVSEDVGYNDLSRFYKQFRKSTSTSPGACRNLLKPRKV
ncbi:MAG TPA: AraC family transcriptional regulator [Pyrinomonadaceae bacterium]|nr:AraC family transcriptional regulator [Pyrinomonadaceae bacterium]